jgi:hypothetical protein
MSKTEPKNTKVEGKLREALDAAESREARYHIRESMQFLHLEDDEDEE